MCFSVRLFKRTAGLLIVFTQSSLCNKPGSIINLPCYSKQTQNLFYSLWFFSCLSLHCGLLEQKDLSIASTYMALVVKNPPASAGDIRDVGSIPALGRSSGEGNGRPLQYSFLENPMERRAWRATVCGVTKSWTWLKWLGMHACKIVP